VEVLKILLHIYSTLQINLYSTVQYCTVLYFTVHYCTVLYCTVLYSTPQINQFGPFPGSAPSQTCWFPSFYTAVPDSLIEGSPRAAPSLSVSSCPASTATRRGVLLLCIQSATRQYCTLQYCTVLSSTVLNCTVLYCTDRSSLEYFDL
jgi:hypothetical protein